MRRAVRCAKISLHPPLPTLFTQYKLSRAVDRVYLAEPHRIAKSTAVLNIVDRTLARLKQHWVPKFGGEVPNTSRQLERRHTSTHTRHHFETAPGT